VSKQGKQGSGVGVTVNEIEKREVQRIVKKYSIRADRKVVRIVEMASDMGRLNKRALAKEGIPRKQVLSIMEGLREKLRDYDGKD
jgi:hypothetical protein